MRVSFSSRIQKEQAQRVLLNPFERLVFFNEYKFFGKDDNSLLYKNFIKKTLNNSTDIDLLTDVIYLAIDINFYSTSFLKKIKELVFSRRHYLLRLACLDYLTYFRGKISASEFYEINLKLSKSENVLIRVQALVNLIRKSPASLKKIMQALSYENEPTLFYRAINAFDSAGVQMKPSEVTDLKNLITNKKFGKKVTNELIKRTMIMKKATNQ